ncbi:MAG: ORF6N domain-containing protein [Nanoarchaeota archaeon]|nr:ORF6N domain-containing protein [Nanoarchaeota archaeon]
MKKLIVLDKQNIKNKIYTIRGLQVMLDADLAELYRVPTKQLNKAVKRNIERFPENFMFQLTESELENLRFQNGTSRSKYGGRRYLPYAFTEEGVAMLSGILKSDIAIKVSIEIMSAFVAMKHFLAKNEGLFIRVDNIERKQIQHDKNFEKIFNAIDQKQIKPKQGIFFNGQIFDAYTFVSDLIRNANQSITLIDNYVDDSVLTLFSKKKENVKVIIYTKEITKQLQLDLNKFNSQYQKIEIKEFNKSHDRFMIIDNKEVYHFGASLKDLGKKWFAFSKFDKEALNLLEKL